MVLPNDTVVVGLAGIVVVVLAIVVEMRVWLSVCRCVFGCVCAGVCVVERMPGCVWVEGERPVRG